jgi:hypothetical protein
VVIEVPFGALRTGTADFDVRLWITTAGFGMGGEYEAVLPTTGVISWWRWVGLDELAGAGQKELKDVMVESSIGEKDMDDGVPVLPEDEQLKIHTSGGKVVFSCVGQPVGPSR